MTKVRPCKKGCGYPAAKRKQFCYWHGLMRLSSDQQAAAANLRRARTLVQDRRPRVPSSEWPEGERWCAGCQSFVPKFYCSGSRCKACSSMAAHAKRLEDNYGIDPAEYDRIFRLQGGRCAICGNQPRTIRFAVDHDHKTDAVRGILCKRCNHDLLGGGHDSIDLLWRAIGYLLFPPAQRTTMVVPDEVILACLNGHLEANRIRARKPAPEAVPPPF